MSTHALLDRHRYLETLRTEADRLVHAALQARHDRPVPWCPGLALGETVRHVGSIYRVVYCWLTHGARPRDWVDEPADGESVEDYLRAALDELFPALAATEAGVPADTWWPEDCTYGFWQRRMAHETTVHRVDVQSAAGVPVTEIPEDIAIDGIDEVLRLWFGHRLTLLGVTGTRQGSVVLHAGKHAWFAHADRTQTEVRRVTADEVSLADGHVRGAPMQVYLWLWGRAPTSAVTTEGDDDAIAQLWALLRLATR
ncbi:maleylpyruvate isomerase N-terminal domain-containing protein [Haloechinothrix sp. LS1_15]|uniref:maleylpyruvate isomerase N-terminal domain-containing protein n=1 Tax=Haloechinothrix sp. LS1_15 TaxID=2652248 RepID=UPI002947CF82|nr:maleylpyruvate isomerase N-terminal domain-containing protein [Haloechinothrix sp. LS1_15]MDV6014510.1 hypothetical protein [Haloechinothrix sp. LS1_15]